MHALSAGETILAFGRWQLLEVYSFGTKCEIRLPNSEELVTNAFLVWSSNGYSSATELT